MSSSSSSSTCVKKNGEFTTLPLMLFPKCNDIPLESRIQGRLDINKINIATRQFVLRELSPASVKLQFYFTCCPRTSVLNMDMYMQEDSGDLWYSESALPTTSVIPSYAIYYAGAYIGCVNAEMSDAHVCSTCTHMHMLPVLVVKLFVYQEDGSDRLLGFGKLNVFEDMSFSQCEENEIYLINTNLSAFVYSATKLLCTSTMKYCILKKATPTPDISEEHRRMFKDVIDDDTLLYSPYDVKNDSPFSRIYDSYRAGIACSIIAMDNVIIPKSAFYVLVGKYITCTYDWAKALIHFQMSIYHKDIKSMFEEVKKVFSYEDAHTRMKTVGGIKKALSGETGKKIINECMHIIINALGAFVYICNIYSYDSYETEYLIEGGKKVQKTKLDTDRNTIYNILAEGTYDCEDGAGIMAVLFKRIRECFLKEKKEEEEEEEDGGFYRFLGVLMDQYEPVLCAMRTSEISYEKDKEEDRELFGHMGALLLPKYFIDKTFKRCTNASVSDVSELLFEDSHYMGNQTGEYIQGEDGGVLDILIMESTTPVYANPRDVIVSAASVVCVSEFVNDVNDMYKPVCYALAENINTSSSSSSYKRGEECSIYEDIVSIHPLQLGDDKWHYKIGTFYVKYGDQTGVSMSDLIKLNSERRFDEISIYYKYIVPDLVLEQCSLYMQMVSPCLLLSVSKNIYLKCYEEYVAKRVTMAKGVSPLYQEFVEGNVKESDRMIPYLPGLLTNGNTDILEAQGVHDRYLCLYINEYEHKEVQLSI